MLLNQKNQIIPITTAIITMLTLGIKAQERLDNGEVLSKSEMKNITRRVNFLKPLKEVLKQPDPNGRSTGGAFSLGARAHFVN